jgi:hypothetical protein
LTSATIPFFANTFQTHPYLFELTVFLLLNSFVIMHAYVTSRAPHGLRILEKKIGMYTRILVENNTGHDLLDCEIEVLNVKGLDSNLPYRLEGLYNKLRWYIQGNIPNGITTNIKNQSHAEAGTVVSYENNVISLEFPHQYAIRDGKTRVDVLFTGHTKQGDTKSSRFWLYIERDGEEINVIVET